ncbi:hypothetical protein ACFFX0_18640 [Citricoccus parietis]|uniref:Uncharacterized protein n=1 Tax=Citricoccus parietis TaxID=592307 RepID=A0ABV5G2F5_9MICC
MRTGGRRWEPLRRRSRPGPAPSAPRCGGSRWTGTVPCAPPIRSWCGGARPAGSGTVRWRLIRPIRPVRRTCLCRSSTHYSTRIDATAHWSSLRADHPRP